jgi:hypothetical protein
VKLEKNILQKIAYQIHFYTRIKFHAKNKAGSKFPRNTIRHIPPATLPNNRISNDCWSDKGWKRAAHAWSWQKNTPCRQHAVGGIKSGGGVCSLFVCYIFPITIESINKLIRRGGAGARSDLMNYLAAGCFCFHLIEQDKYIGSASALWAHTPAGATRSAVMQTAGRSAAAAERLISALSTRHTHRIKLLAALSDCLTLKFRLLLWSN